MKTKKLRRAEELLPPVEETLAAIVQTARTRPEPAPRPTVKEEVKRWLAQKKAQHEGHFKLLLLAGDMNGRATLGELVAQERWEEALAVINRIRHW